MTPTISSSGIIGVITMCHNGSLAMKSANLLFFTCVYFCHFGVFINIHEYELDHLHSLSYNIRHMSPL